MRLKSITAAIMAAAVFCLAGLQAAPAQAMSLDQWRREKTNEVSAAYVMGVSMGYGWANEHLGIEGQKMLYCQPRDLAITYEMLSGIIEDFARAHPGVTGDMQVEGIMLFALIAKYPCRQA